MKTILEFNLPEDKDGILQLVRDRLYLNMEEKGLQYPE